MAIGSLFPPSGALRDVGLRVTAIDDVTANPTITVRVQSDERLVVGDVSYAAGVLSLRATRNDSGDGRVYLVYVTATDEAGNRATACTAVTVPHDNSPTALDSANVQAVAAMSNCTLPTPSCAPVEIVAWWPLDGNGIDVIGGHTLNFIGNPSVVAGKVGQALSFDAIDDSASTASSAALDVGIGAGLTIEGWINPTDLEIPRPVVEWNNTFGAIGTLVWLSTDTLVFGDGYRNIVGNLVDTSGVSHIVRTEAGLLSTNEWQHIALTYDKASGQAAIYYDGVLAGQENLGSFTPQTSYPLYFGVRPSGPINGLRFAGSMDELSLYSRALSLSEIAAIFSAGAGGKCGPVSP